MCCVFPYILQNGTFFGTKNFSLSYSSLCLIHFQSVKVIKSIIIVTFITFLLITCSFSLLFKLNHCCMSISLSVYLSLSRSVCLIVNLSLILAIATLLWAACSCLLKKSSENLKSHQMFSGNADRFSRHLII